MIVYFIPEPSAADAVITATEQKMPEGASKQTQKEVKEERKNRKSVLMSGIITAIGAHLNLFGPNNCPPPSSFRIECSMKGVNL